MVCCRVVTGPVVVGSGDGTTGADGAITGAGAGTGAGAEEPRPGCATGAEATGLVVEAAELGVTEGLVTNDGAGVATPEA